MPISGRMITGFAWGALLGVVISHGIQSVVAQQAQQGQSFQDLAQRAVEAALAARTAVMEAVPKGTVMAFNLPECPTGWGSFAPLAGRVAVGAGIGNRDKNDRALSERKLGQMSGEENHVLTVDELAEHNHTNGNYTALLHQGGGWTTKEGDNGSPPEPTLNTSGNIIAAGKNAGHNTMPPYYVLTYCERK